MALEDRIRRSVEAALDELRTHAEHDLRRLVDQLLATAAQEREDAVNTARRAAFDEAWHNTQREVAEAEARARAASEQSQGVAREQDRLESERRVAEALAGADARLTIALSDAEAKAAHALKDAMSDAEAREHEARARLGRLLEGIRRLDAGSSLSEVLDRVGEAVSREVTRTAVFVLRQEQLIGWRLTGFGAADLQPKSLERGLSEGGVLAAAVTTAQTARTGHLNGAATGPDLAEIPEDRVGIAVPVVVGGRVVAVVYADNVGAEGEAFVTSSGWLDATEILTRHAARCLEALTVQKAAVAPSPRFWVPSGQPTLA